MTHRRWERLCREDCRIEMLGANEIASRRVLCALLATDALEVCLGASAVTSDRRIATLVPATRRDIAGPGSYRLSGGTVPAHARRERLHVRLPVVSELLGAPATPNAR